MSTQSQRSQSESYQLLLESSRSDPFGLTLAESLEKHHKLVRERQHQDDSFLWCLLRFCEDGTLHSIHRDSDFPEASEYELTQLLTTGDQYSFQIFVRRYGHGAPLTAGDIRAFDKAWKPPNYLWVAILQTGLPYLFTNNLEQVGLMSTQLRSTYINENYLYVPDASSGKIKSGSSSFVSWCDAYPAQQLFSYARLTI